MLSSEALAYCERGIVRYLNNNMDKFLELTTKAMAINEEIPDLMPCRYKLNGEWVQARICFQTGCIYNLNGNLLRRGHGIRC